MGIVNYVLRPVATLSGGDHENFDFRDLIGPFLVRLYFRPLAMAIILYCITCIILWIYSVILFVYFIALYL